VATFGKDENPGCSWFHEKREESTTAKGQIAASKLKRVHRGGGGGSSRN